MKFNGVIQEIIDHPNIDATELLQDRLRIPADKAEILAERIKKQYSQKPLPRTQQPVKLLETPKSTPPCTYSFDALSLKEFQRFMIWLLEALGFEIQLKKDSVASTADLLTAKNAKQIAVITQKSPKSSQLSDSIITVAEQAKSRFNCGHVIVIVTSSFSEEAKSKAEVANIELWDLDAIARKIAEVKKAAVEEEKTGVPQYKGTLLQSLLRLEETKDFIIEPRGEKYDLHLPGVKFPLLTFQSSDGEVTRCVFRIIKNEPVSEFSGIPLIGKGADGKRSGPDSADAYSQIIQYLEQFLQ